MRSSIPALPRVVAALLPFLAIACASEPFEGALLRIEFGDSARYPVSILEAIGGPPGSVRVLGASFTPGAAPDTLYVASWGPAAAGAQFPVC